MPRWCASGCRIWSRMRTSRGTFCDVMTTPISMKPAEPAATAPATHTDEVIGQAKHVLLQNYKQQPIVLTRGHGSYLWDAEGKRYLDLIAGIATCALGHCHPAVTEAVKKQLDTLWHVSNVFYSEPQIQLADRLTRAAGPRGAGAFFCTPGAEANEALIKPARRYQHVVKGNAERSDIIT